LWLWFKMCLLLVRAFVTEELFLVFLVVFWDFCCHFWVIVSYKCNHVESWRFVSVGVWHCVVISLYFRGMQCPHLQAEGGVDCLSLRMKAPKLLKMLATTHPTSQCYIPEDLTLQQQHCENCKISHYLESCWEQCVVSVTLPRDWTLNLPSYHM
jgi:hypothetical protein